MSKNKNSDLKKVLINTPFSLDKNKIKIFMKDHLDLYTKLPDIIEENKTNKNIVENTIKLFNLISINVKMLPILRKLIAIKTNKSNQLKIMKLLETIFASTTPIEVKSIKFDPMILYDYLFSHARSDDVVLQVYALMCLHHLITNYDLTVPNYLQLVYSTLTKRLMYSPILATFYDRIYKYLVGRTNPLYISACFVKKSLRLSLEAPTGAIVIILHFVLRMLFSLPQIRYLVKLPSVPVYKYPEYDVFEVEDDDSDEEGEENNDDEKEDKQPKKKESKMNRDLSKLHVDETFLWEHLLLQNHPHPKVALLAQSFPKTPDDKVDLPPDLNIKGIADPKVSPITTTISININPFLIVDNNQMVNYPNDNDCAEMGLQSTHSLYGDYFD